MIINPCVVIPSYNHGYALQSLLDNLNSLHLPILVVNDGSTDSTAETLNQLRRVYPRLSVINKVVNGGKGAAVVDGLMWALAKGYSHAVLVDSDGQHCTEDIPRFIAVAERNPDACVLGSPSFGEDAPIVRRIGREISNVFVACVTMKCAARDVLCGFRVYPIKVVNTHIDLARLQSRMGFDVEIVIRALWSGIPVVNVPTRVVYPAGGISHFKYGADNRQLARLYVRLAIEALYRVPIRLLSTRVGGSAERRSWFQMAERGSLRGLRALLLLLEKVGRIPLLILLGPIVLGIFARGGGARRAAVDFQKRVSRLEGEEPETLRIYIRALRQFWEFGVSIVDKVVSWREGIPLEKFTWEGRDEVRAHLAQGKGVILMGAHVGNMEVIRALGESRKIIVNALMYTANSRHFRAFLEEVNQKTFLRVIDLSSMDPSIVFDLQERLNQGEIVALLGDRATKYSVGRVLSIPFLGQPAVFPEGPWILMSLLNAPVFTIFSMRERGGRYRVEISRLADRIELPRSRRQEALRGYIGEFASRLGAIVMRYPYQWFNFYQFWPDVQETPDLVPSSSSEPVVHEPVR